MISCQKAVKKTEHKHSNQSHCIVTKNLIGKQFLDHNFLAAIEGINISPIRSTSKKGLVFIKGGEFEMGGDFPESTMGVPKTALPQGDEFPKHRVKISDFYMDEHEVTVAEFMEFVTATGYKTVAEQDVDWDELKKQLPPNTPKPDAQDLKAGAIVFNYAPETVKKNNLANWWVFKQGAYWKKPEGKSVDIETIKNFPVTQISWYDAMAYAKWVGKRLPTEAEYEYAMRGGENNKMYPWGGESVNEGAWKGNFLQGNFPYNNTALDGFEKLAPVKSFPPNAYGLYDIAGNVWEWTMDWYSPLYYKELKDRGEVAINPKGSVKSEELYNSQAMNKVVRGGSFLCNDDWCSGYRNARRMRLTPDSGMQHLGFRLVRDIK